MNTAAMSDQEMNQRIGHRLLQFGIVLFTLGLMTGFVSPMLASPRLGLTSHLEGVLNGILLLILGLMWSRLRLGSGARRLAFWLLVYGTYVNWATTLLAAIWGLRLGPDPRD